MERMALSEPIQRRLDFSRATSPRSPGSNGAPASPQGMLSLLDPKLRSSASRRIPTNKISAPSLESDSDDDFAEPEQPQEAPVIPHRVAGADVTHMSPQAYIRGFPLYSGTLAESPRTGPIASPHATFSPSSGPQRAAVIELEDLQRRDVHQLSSASPSATSPASRTPKQTRPKHTDDEVELMVREMNQSRRLSVERAVERQVAQLASLAQDLRHTTQAIIQQKAADSMTVEQELVADIVRRQAEFDRSLDLRLQQLRMNADMKHHQADQSLTDFLRQKEAEDAERRRREAEALAAEQRAREEADRKRREEEAKALAAAEAARKRVEAEAAAAAAEAKRVQEEEAKRKAASSVSNAQQQSTISMGTAVPTAHATGAPKTPAPSSDTISGSARINLLKMKALYRKGEQVKASMEQHPKRRDIYKTIHLNCNQITNMKTQIRNKIVALGTVLSGSRQAGELEYSYCLFMIAQKLVDQCDILITRQPSSAWGVAHTLVPLSIEHPMLMDYVLSCFYDRCPYVVPGYPKRGTLPDGSMETEEDFLYKKLKYKQKEDGRETDESYCERMAGYLYLYGAITCVPASNNTHGIEDAWTWLARVLNLPPRRPTASVLLAMLTQCGHALLETYGPQFRKILGFMKTTFVPRLPCEVPIDRAAKARLEIYISNYETSRGQIPVPEGFVPTE